jgi:hypothetical protein
MPNLNDVREKFNQRSVEWLENCLQTLGWTSQDLARRIDAENPYLYKTIDRILNERVKTPQLATLEDISEVLRKEELITQARLPIKRERLAGKWLAYTLGREENEIDSRPGKRTTIGMLGSYKGMSDLEKNIAERIISSLPSKLIGAGIRVVVGDSIMLQDFLHNCRDIHNQSDTAVPNPVLIFGRLRKRDLHDLFEDTINCIPDLAILIGGDIEKGRVKEEYDGAVKADIPIICIASTGGVAKQVKSVAEKASHLFDVLNQTGDNIDTGDLISAIWEAIVIYERLY